MRLVTLRLALLRSWRRLRLDLPPGLIAIAGPNGSGKTNILEAASLLAPGRGLRGASPADLIRRQDGAGWRVEAALEGGRMLRTECLDPLSARRTAQIDEKPAPLTALGGALRMLWLTPELDRVFLEGPSERRRLLDRLTLAFHPDHGETAARYDRAMRERNRLLRDGADDPRWLAALEAQMAEAGPRMAAARLDAVARLTRGQAGETVFPRADLSLEGFDLGPEDFAAALHDGRGRDAAAGRSLIGPHRVDLHAVFAAKNAPAAACSTGEQKALLLSIILAAARELRAETGAPPVLLFDEVAAHLDANRRAALIGAMQALGAQAFMTGADWALFDAMEGGLRLETRDENGESHLRVVNAG